MNRDDTPMVMRIAYPNCVRDHLGKPIAAFHSENAGWRPHGPFYIVLVQRNTPGGVVQDSHTIPALWCAVSIYNIDVAKLAEEQARKQELARAILATPGLDGHDRIDGLDGTEPGEQLQ